MATLELACGADRGYLPHSAAMMHSVLVNSGELDVRVHLLHGPGLSAKIRDGLARMADREGGQMAFHEIPDAWVADLPAFEGITRAMWYRIYLPQLAPDCDRVLYLDGDALAVDTLEPLWATDLGDHLVGAVTNVFMQVPRARAIPQSLGLPGLSSYFNSGVLLMNLRQMRLDYSTTELLRFAGEHDLVYPDQDAFNGVMGHRRVALHPRWNCMNSIMNFEWATEVLDPAEIEQARRNPGIRHFEGPARNKPWHRGCAAGLRDLYFEHRQATPWPRVRLEGPRPWRGRLGLRRALRRRR